MHSEWHQLPYPGFTHIRHLVWHSLLKTQKGLSPLWSLALKHKFTQCLYCFTLTRQHFWDNWDAFLRCIIYIKTKKQVHIFKIVQESLKISVNLLLRHRFGTYSWNYSGCCTTNLVFPHEVDDVTVIIPPRRFKLHKYFVTCSKS